MKVTHIVADGRFAEAVLRDATPQEESAVATAFQSHIDQAHDAALREDALRGSLSAFQAQYPQQAALLYNVLSALGLNTFTVPTG